MEPITSVVFANLALSILEIAVKEISLQVQKGQISVETQQGILDRINALRPVGGEIPQAFNKPEWKVE